MKSSQKFVIFGLIFFQILTGCVLMSDNCDDSNISPNMDSFNLSSPPPATQATAPTPIIDKNYRLNDHLSAERGSTVLRVVGYYQRNYVHGSLETDNKIVLTSNLDKLIVPVGQHPIIGTITYRKEPFYVIGPFNKKYILLDQSMHVQKKVLFRGANDKKYYMLSDYHKMTPTNASFKRVYSSTKDTIPFVDFEAVYNGIQNGQISFFVKDAVPGSEGRAGSFDTISYPADATLIILRGTKIRVIKADAQRFDYIVIED